MCEFTHLRFAKKNQDDRNVLWPNGKKNTHLNQTSSKLVYRTCSINVDVGEAF